MSSLIAFTTFKDLLLEFFIDPPPSICLTLVLATTIIISNLWSTIRSSRKIFLLDFSCYKPPATQLISRGMTMEILTCYFHISKDSLDFIKKTLDRSGLGPLTYVPRAFLVNPPNLCLEEARKESETVVFGAIDELLGKTGVKCNDIGIVILNCSVFNVVPSLCSMIVNRYKLRDDVLTYNLTGMGCSAGLLAIGLAKNLLQVHHNSYALLVSTENLTQNMYQGDDRAKLLGNCIFRVGGSAVLLTNRPSDAKMSKYRLLHTVRTNTSRFDDSFKCIFQEDDPLGHRGLDITRSLIVVVNEIIKANLAELGTLILPLTEQARFLAHHATRRVEPFVPRFKTAVDHLFPHVGGKLVLDELEKSLRFSEADMEPSRMTLYKFGNTSSSSVWYEVAYAEAKGRIVRGDRLWQVAFGSGFKCSSVIWEAIGTVGGYEEANPWSREIDQFPVEMGFVEPVPYDFKL